MKYCCCCCCTNGVTGAGAKLLRTIPATTTTSHQPFGQPASQATGRAGRQLVEAGETRRQPDGSSVGPTVGAGLMAGDCFGGARARMSNLARARWIVHHPTFSVQVALIWPLICHRSAGSVLSVLSHYFWPNAHWRYIIMRHPSERARDRLTAVAYPYQSAKGLKCNFVGQI